MKKVLSTLAVMACVVSALSGQAQTFKIVMKRDEPLQRIIFAPDRPPSAHFRHRLFVSQLRCYPTIIQTFQKDAKELLLHIETPTEFYDTSVTFALDGEVATIPISWQQKRSIFGRVEKSYAVLDSQTKLIRRIAKSQEAWVTIISTADDFRMSVKLTDAQLTLFRLMLDCYSSLDSL